MPIETIPFREIEKRTGDMYEATLVMAKRARQIAADRIATEEFEELEQEPGLLEEPPLLEEYVEQEKVTTIAIREFLNDELEWTYGNSEEEESPTE